MQCEDRVLNVGLKLVQEGITEAITLKRAKRKPNPSERTRKWSKHVLNGTEEHLKAKTSKSKNQKTAKKVKLGEQPQHD